MGFENYHPAINFIYFLSVLTGTFLFPQPVFLAISWGSAFCYSLKRNGRRSLLFGLCLIPPALGFALYYGSYHHFGMTVLGHNFIDNAMTLESFVYGLVLALQVSAALMWCSCIFSVFTTDKVVYLFGRVSPRLSLYLAIVLRIVPRCRIQFRRIRDAGYAIGRGRGNLPERVCSWVRAFSMLITWLLESLSSVAASMGSRGCGLKGRTAFSIYRFDNRDRSFVVGIFACLTLTAMAMLLDQTSMLFDPRLVMNPITPLSFLFYGAYLVLCLLPLALEILSQHRFSRLQRAVCPPVPGA